MVKPILKKLASSPKNSLDLDRGWEEQSIDLGYGHGAFEPARTSMSRSVRDVSFQFPPWEPPGSTTGSGTATPVGGGLEPTASSVSVGGVGGGAGGGVGVAGGVAGGLGLGIGIGATGARNINRGRFQHARSTSGTSHVSIATNGSNHRPGASFVHPFQQTPRTNTPPLTYANSFTSFERENGNPVREYSPTIITENDDDDDLDNTGSTSLSQSLTSHLYKPAASNSHSTTSLRRPSLASQRTSSLSDINNHSSSSGANTNAPLRVNTATSFPRSIPSASSKLAHGALSSPYSNSDLHLNISPSDSPRPSIQLASPTSNSTTPMSPLRTSLEGAFRLRSRSEVDTGARREDIREARRKFEENERIKQEKYESEQRRKQERKQEKERATARKNTGGSSEMSSIGRPSFSRKRTPPLTSALGARRTRSGESVSQSGTMSEKVLQPGTPGAAFMSSNYESTEGGATPSFGPDVTDVRFESAKRANTAKRRTQSYWTSFVLWFRTRLLKIGRR